MVLAPFTVECTSELSECASRRTATTLSPSSTRNRSTRTWIQCTTVIPVRLTIVQVFAMLFNFVIVAVVVPVALIRFAVAWGLVNLTCYSVEGHLRSFLTCVVMCGGTCISACIRATQ